MPTLKGKDHNDQCPACGAAIHGTFLVLNGGALEGDVDHATMMDKGIGFLNLHWHDHEHPKTLDVVDAAPKGQFDLMFCNTDCFRKWVEDLLRELDSQPC